MRIFKQIIDFIKKASIPSFKFENNHLFFKLKDDSFYKYDLNEYDMKTRHASYVLEAYTLSNSDIFLEYIKIDNQISWNGQTLSLYQDFFKEKLFIESTQTLETKNIGTYTFKVLKINDSFVLHIIHIFMVKVDVIIIDMKGELYKNLLFRLDDNYLYRYDNEEKGSVNFDISLVKENSLRGFFGVGD